MVWHHHTEYHIKLSETYLITLTCFFQIRNIKSHHANIDNDTKKHNTGCANPYPLVWSVVVTVGADDTTWKVGWITKEVFALGAVLLSCWRWAAISNFCCCSIGRRSPSWVSCVVERSWVEPVAVRREPGLLSMDAELPVVLMPIWVGITWTWTVPECELVEPLDDSLGGISVILERYVCVHVEVENMEMMLDGLQENSVTLGVRYDALYKQNPHKACHANTIVELALFCCWHNSPDYYRQLRLTSPTIVTCRNECLPTHYTTPLLLFFFEVMQIEDENMFIMRQVCITT